ncbi:MAG: glycosyltransferase family A protein [Pseudomonadota bacterium]
MSEDQSIDVLIPVHNAADTLSEALRSIQDQSIDSFRIVIVDDGSTDTTPEILEHAARKDGRIEIHRIKNGGVAAALNHGLAFCTARFIARFDADDISYPDRLKIQRNYLLEHSDCVAVGCDVDHIDQFGGSIIGMPQPGDPNACDPDWVPAIEPYIVHPFLFAHRSAIMDVGGYRSLRTSQDTDLYWRLGSHGRLHNLKERLGMYRIHAKSVSGARISSGRVMAVCSQLAALSASRNRASLPDLNFPITTPLFDAIDTPLTEMVAAFDSALSARERHHIRLSVGAKLMELSGYRDYELALSDCRFIAALDPTGLRLENIREFRWYRTMTASRLLDRGDFRAAFTLAGPQGFLVALARSMARLVGLKR